MTLSSPFYRAPDSAIWQGRTDAPAGPLTARWHQTVKPLPLDAETPPLRKEKSISFALLGFACDEGVRRNQGRPGAAEGPSALRRAAANLPWHRDDVRLLDAGDVVCAGDELEAAQENLRAAVTELLRRGHVPLLLGGGHEMAFGHALGIRDYLRDKPARRKTRLGIVNFDAHFDLRPDPTPSSGTPFRQIARAFHEKGENFSYLCLGVQKSANTRLLFEAARELKVRHAPADEWLNARGLAAVRGKLGSFVKNHDALYVTVCLDVVAAAFAPGVSAPTACGLTPHAILPLLKDLASSGKAVSFDVAELNPSLDLDGRTARLAAHFLFAFTDAYRRR